MAWAAGDRGCRKSHIPTERPGGPICKGQWSTACQLAPVPWLRPPAPVHRGLDLWARQGAPPWPESQAELEGWSHRAPHKLSPDSLLPPRTLHRISAGRRAGVGASGGE